MAIKKITKKQRAILSKYEQNLRTALYSNYVRAMSVKTIDEVKEVYEQITGVPYKMTYNCGACVLDLMKRTAAYYFNK